MAEDDDDEQQPPKVPADLPADASLQILNPPSTSPPSASKKKSRTEIYLEELGTAMCYCVSTRNWDHWAVGHITDDFEAFIEHSDTPFATNVEEYKEAYNSIAKKHPGYRNELIDINAEVDERKGLATLWILLRIHHDPTETMKESVTMAYLRKVRGKWLFYKQTGIRGIEMSANSDDFLPATNVGQASIGGKFK